MGRTWAIIEREMRRFRRSPVLIVIAMVMPLVQLVVLGYAFGGNVKHLKLAIVDQDRGVPAVKVRELAAAIASGARTIDTLEYTDPGAAEPCHATHAAGVDAGVIGDQTDSAAPQQMDAIGEEHLDTRTNAGGRHRYRPGRGGGRTARRTPS